MLHYSTLVTLQIAKPVQTNYVLYLILLLKAVLTDLTSFYCHVV